MVYIYIYIYMGINIYMYISHRININKITTTMKWTCLIHVEVIEHKLSFINVLMLMMKGAANVELIGFVFVMVKNGNY